MKKLIIIPLLFFALLSFGQHLVYYVSPTGSNAYSAAQAQNPATPWATAQKAIDNVVAGDTVLFRGGTFTPTIGTNYTPNAHGKDGTATHHITLKNYPGEVPVFDCINQTQYQSDGYNFGIMFMDADYIDVKGLTFKNINQLTTGVPDNRIVRGFDIFNCTYFTLTNCTVHNAEGHGFQAYESQYIYFTNCDSYNNADSLNPTSPGNTAAGFSTVNNGANNPNYTKKGPVYYYGCRSWHNSDDGFDGRQYGVVWFDRCWTWNNGYLTSGAGSGFKMGFLYLDMDTNWVVTNCISTYNITGTNRIGFNENEYTGTARPNIFIYNNLFYKNGSVLTGSGIYVTPSTLFQENQNIYKNNISYANLTTNIEVGGLYVHSYNSWDHSPSVTVSDADFKDLPADLAECYTVLGAARGADGSLPSLGDFFHIAAGSDLIDAGISVNGVPYDGDGNYRDLTLGPFSYIADEPVPPELPQIIGTAVQSSTAVSALIGGTITSNGGGTLTYRGMVWSTSINPTIADSKTKNPASLGSFIDVVRGLKGGVLYNMRAYVTNETGTSYGANIGFTTSPYSVVLKSGNAILHNGITDSIPVIIQ